MKKFFVIISLCFLGGMVKSNPIYVPPSISISELYFDPSDPKKWSLEIRYYAINYIDSIYISTSTGKSKIKWLRYDEGIGLKVLTSDSLLSGVSINPLGDSITIQYFVNKAYYSADSTDILVFGNYRNSIISAPLSGHSIYRLMDESFILPGSYCKDKSPSLGGYNYDGDNTGTLNGIIYDYADTPLANSKYTFNYPENLYNAAITDQTGFYSNTILARRYSIDSLFIWNRTYPGSIEYNLFNVPLKFDMEPDEVITRNIYLTNVWVGIDEVTSGNNFIKIFPNPLNSGRVINYETVIPVISSKCTLELLDLQGRIWKCTTLDNAKGIFTLPDGISKGIYVLNFKGKGKVYKSIRLNINN
jgi:hypothetical protein